MEYVIRRMLPKRIVLITEKDVINGNASDDASCIDARRINRFLKFQRRLLSATLPSVNWNKAPSRENTEIEMPIVPSGTFKFCR